VHVERVVGTVAGAVAPQQADQLLVLGPARERVVGGVDDGDADAGAHRGQEALLGGVAPARAVVVEHQHVEFAARVAGGGLGEVLAGASVTATSKRPVSRSVVTISGVVHCQSWLLAPLTTSARSGRVLRSEGEREKGQQRADDEHARKVANSHRTGDACSGSDKGRACGGWRGG
jgi:hypothetical protein